MTPLIELPMMSTVIFKSTGVLVPVTRNEMYLGTVTYLLPINKVPTRYYLLPGIFLMFMLRICVSEIETY